MDKKGSSVDNVSWRRLSPEGRRAARVITGIELGDVAEARMVLDREIRVIKAATRNTDAWWSSSQMALA